jgi:6-phosphogluconolactonase (cycloisomerase 2 family)
VTGLVSGTSVVLQLNGADNTPVAVNSSFSFSTMLASGSSYSVTVLTQPVGESCTTQNAIGMVASANVSVAVGCVANAYTVGGNVQGLLAGGSLSVTDNGGNAASISANGGFTFSNAVSSGSAYAVAVSAQPTGQNCAVTNGNGTIAGASIANVSVTCSTLPYTVSVTVFGLLPNSNLVLQNNGGDNLTVSSPGTYNFKTPIASQATYAVSILTQAQTQACFVVDPTGTILASNFTVMVVCPWHIAYMSAPAASPQSGGVLAFYTDPTTGGFFPANVFGNSPPQSFVSVATAVTPNKKFLYALSDSAIAAYGINPSTGNLSTVAGSPFATPAGALSVTIDATGSFLYVGSIGFRSQLPTISAYAIDATTGALNPIAGSPYTTSGFAPPMVADPGGNFLFTGVGTYSIDSGTGALSSTAPTDATGCSFTIAFAINPPRCAAIVTSHGKFLYTAYTSGSDSTSPSAVAGYGIDANTGHLTALTGSPYQGLSAPATSIAATPDGQFIYVANDAGNSGNIAAYKVNQITGALAPIMGQPYSLSSPFVFSCLTIAIDPSGQFAYVTDVHGPGVWIFSIDPGTGALSPSGSSNYTSLGNVGGYSIAVISLP